MTESKLYASLFTPLGIGPMTLGNRVASAAMVSNMADVEGGVSDQIVDLYTERAVGGAGLITVEMSAVHPQGRGW